MSSYAASFNPPEDQREFTTVITQSPISDKRPAATVTPSRRKKAKKFVDTTKKLSNMGNMYGVMLKRGFALLFCELGNNSDALNYRNPGSCKKCWATKFEKGKYFCFVYIVYLIIILIILTNFVFLTDLKNNAFGDDFPIVTLFPKRRNTEQDGDAFIRQKVSENFGMNAYMCILNEGEDNSDNLKKVAESVCQVMNKYAANCLNNANPVEYCGDISANVPDSQR